MPEMDGFQFFKEVKKNKEMANVLFMVQTGRKAMEDSFAGLGVMDFLSKPCQPDDLYAKIESIFARVSSTIVPEPLSIPDIKRAVVNKSIKGQVELTPEQKQELNKNYIKAGAIFGGIMFVISIGVFMRATVFISGNKDHSVARQLMNTAVDESQLNGIINEYDEEKRLRAVMFYDNGILKWRKLYDEKGFLTASEKY